MKKSITLLSAIALAISSQAQTPTEVLDIIIHTSPLPDLLNTDPKILLDAAQYTVLAREEMPWNVPQREFEHFVVPLRVNNEPIDAHRPIIYNILKDRVKGMSMEDAVLEVNHWCHEYVNYQPSDARTHSPLESMSSCIGRCGEESTFTVSALRAIGIPARQVYTPRWAHTDDNHAWVEAWVDGEWKFLGACEPEPILNLAWFNSPATRSMMMHTFVRGEYDGPEDVVAILPDGVNINVTSTYAPTVKTAVKVVDKDGKPVKDAEVSFRIYNYAEYYPIATTTTDADGMAHLTSGIGDMLVWGTKDGKYGFLKATAGTPALTVTLDREPGNIQLTKYEWDFVPPKQGSNLAVPTKSQIEENLRRFAQEDSIRQSRLDKFMTEEGARALAREWGLPQDRVVQVMKEARGNHEVIKDALESAAPQDKERMLRLIESLSEKDRADVKPDVLIDHFKNTPYGEGDIYNEYILSPRIEVESLSPWREVLSENLPDFKNADELVSWIKENITIIPGWNPNAVSIHPEQVLKSRKANARSRDLFFVAAARAKGIPARKDQITGQIQWTDKDTENWHQVKWDNEETSVVSKKGQLTFVVDPENRVKNPVYYTHFTLSKIEEDGTPMLLEYDEEANYEKDFSEPLSLDCGDYVLTTGQRLANGSVLATSTFFSLGENESMTLPLRVRHDNTAVEVIGNFNSENRYYPLTASGETEAEKSILATTGRGYYVIGILSPTNEPSNHTLRDLAAVKGALEEAGVPIVLMLQPGADTARFMASDLVANLPAQTALGVDKDNISFNELVKNMDLQGTDLPVFAIADTFNRVVFVTEGYTIGLGQTLLDILSAIDR